MRIRSSHRAWSEYGGLGPDLENAEIASKRAALLRVKYFSDQLRENNRDRVSSGSNSRKPHPFPPKVISNRERAFEFAKSIPKPKSLIPQTESSRECLEVLEDVEHDELTTMLARHRVFQERVKELKQRYS